MEVTGSPSPMAEAKCAEDKNGVRRRVWESQDFTITKIVIEEGGDDQDGNEMTTPRFGAACSVQGEQRKKVVYELGLLPKWYTRNGDYHATICFKFTILLRKTAYTFPPTSVSAISCSGVDLNRLRNDSTISRYLKEKTDSAAADCNWLIGGGDTEVDITLERVLQTMTVGEKCEAAIRSNLNQGRQIKFVKSINL